MDDNQRRLRLKYISAIVWLLFTVSFAVWWMYYGLKLLNQLAELLPATPEAFARQRRMLHWEGAAWLLLLFGGGATLIYYVAREARRARELKAFFAVFSHDVKTSMASLRLQAESLKEDFSVHSNPLFDRLVADTVRLHLQLQNSLFLASHEDLKLYIEKVSLKKVVESLNHEWPGVTILLDRDAEIDGDGRALQSIFANITHNAVVHGGANQLAFTVNQLGLKRVRVTFRDNGKGFQGDFTRLGQLFFRHSSTSGSGVGLYICRELLGRMDGELKVINTGVGFGGEMSFPGVVL